MSVTKGRREPCNDNIGGIRNIYLATYVEHNVRDVQGYRTQNITSYPSTQVYKYEGQNKTFVENLNEDGSYNQEVGLRLIKQDLATAQLLSLLIKNKVIAVIEDRLGRFRVAGCLNGLDAEINATVGSSKVDFNGYDLTLIGVEEFQAPFIVDLDNYGITDKTVTLGCILASSDRPASLSNKVADCNAVI